MPASGALGPFLEAMMKLRAQRLQEQEDKDKGMAGLGEGIAGGISSIGKGLGDAMQQKKDFDLGNKIGASQPNVPGGWQGGGAREIELRKAMGQYGNTAGDDYYKQASFQLRQAAEARAARGEQESANRYKDTLARNESQDQRQQRIDAEKLVSDQQQLMKDLNDPNITPELHSQISARLEGLRSTAEKNKFSLPQVSIPPYMTKQQQADVSEYQRKLREVQEPGVGYTTKGWGGETESEAGRAEREARQTLPSTFGQNKVVPGYTPPPLAPQQQGPATGGGGQGGYTPDDAPIGATGVAGGKRYIKTAQGWVQQR